MNSKSSARNFGWPRECLHVKEIESNGPGNALVLELAFGNVTEDFTGFGERGVLAETVAEKVVQEVPDYLASGLPVGEHLADQLLILIALIGNGLLKTGILRVMPGQILTSSRILGGYLPCRANG